MAIFINLTSLKKSEKKQKHNETRAMQEQYFDGLPFFCRYIEAWNLKNAFEALERMVWSIRTDGQCQEEIKKLVHHLRLLMFDLRNIKIIWEIILSFEGGVEGAIDKEFKYVKNTGVLTAILVRRDVLSTVKICRACLFVCVVLVMFKALFGMFIKHFSRWFYNWNISVTKTARNLQFGQRFVRWSFT